jgi:hypothetical protein
MVLLCLLLLFNSIFPFQDGMLSDLFHRRVKKTVGFCLKRVRCNAPDCRLGGGRGGGARLSCRTSKAILHNTIFLATCNVVLLLGDTKL